MSFDPNTDRRLNLDLDLPGLDVFDTPKALRVMVPVTGLHPVIDTMALDTQLLGGEDVSAYAAVASLDGPRLLVQAAADGYVGFANADHLVPDSDAVTHRVAVPRTFAFSGPDLKLPVADTLSIGTRLVVRGAEETRGTRYLKTQFGWCVDHHLRLADVHDHDPVAVAETLLHTPYLWGGRSGFGIDCSGLVQLCLAMAGQSVLRDTDMQAATIGTGIDGDELKRGDLVFWTGHVAVMVDGETIVHANGRTMDVAIEPLREVIERIEPLHGRPTRYRRVQ